MEPWIILIPILIGFGVVFFVILLEYRPRPKQETLHRSASFPKGGRDKIVFSGVNEDSFVNEIVDVEERPDGRIDLVVEDPDTKEQSTIKNLRVGVNLFLKQGTGALFGDLVWECNRSRNGFIGESPSNQVWDNSPKQADNSMLEKFAEARTKRKTVAQIEDNIQQLKDWKEAIPSTSRKVLEDDDDDEIS